MGKNGPSPSPTFPSTSSVPLKPICPLIVSGLLLLSSIASAEVNNPPIPPDDPPTTCSTGRQNGADCGSEAPRGYRLNCPGLSPNTVVPVIRYLCQTPTDPVIPVLECVTTSGSVRCEGFPSGTTDLLFQWESDAPVGMYITATGENKRFAEIRCTAPWTGAIKVTVINQLSGAASYKSASVSCDAAR